VRTLKTLLIFSIALLGTGCIFVGTPRGEGDLTIFYTFGGQRCDAVGVSEISLVVDGTSVNDGTTRSLDCATFFDGVTIGDLAAGSYEVQIQGLSASGAVLYETTTPVAAQVIAGADNEIEVNAISHLGELGISWSFAGETRCSVAGVVDVGVTLYDPSGALYDQQTFSCAVGGVFWENVTPGEWTLVLTGHDSFGDPVYRASGPFTVQAGVASDYNVDLAWQAGQTTLFWTFGGSATCGSVGTVWVQVRDAAGQIWDEANYACNSGGVVYDVMVKGDYTVSMEGMIGTTAAYGAYNASFSTVANTSKEYVVDLAPL